MQSNGQWTSDLVNRVIVVTIFGISVYVTLKQLQDPSSYIH